jgi:hypothetical protein
MQPPLFISLSKTYQSPRSSATGAEKKYHAQNTCARLDKSKGVRWLGVRGGHKRTALLEACYGRGGVPPLT